MEPINTINVSATHTIEVPANRAQLHITIKGTHLVLGNAVLEKAREVNTLVQELLKLGIEKNDITLESIQADITSGLLSKSTSATYALKVLCRNLDNLPEILTIVTGQKNITLNSLEWGYPEDQSLLLKGLSECTRIAQEKANTIANVLNIKLLGVHKFVDRQISQQEEIQMQSGYTTLGRAKSRAISMQPLKDEFSCVLNQAKKIDLFVEIIYRIEQLS